MPDRKDAKHAEYAEPVLCECGAGAGEIYAAV